MKTIIIAFCMLFSGIVNAGPLEAARAYIFNIAYVNDSGSGTFIAPNIIVTNYHVVFDDNEKPAIGKQVLIRIQGGIKSTVIVAYNQEQDVAIIQTTSYVHKTYAHIFQGDIERLREAWAFGHPGGLPVVVTHGMYQFKLGDCLVSSAPIFYGNSGGSATVYNPYLDRMELFGITSNIMKSGPNVYPHASCVKPIKLALDLIQ